MKTNQHFFLICGLMLCLIQTNFAQRLDDTFGLNYIETDEVGSDLFFNSIPTRYVLDDLSAGRYNFELITSNDNGLLEYGYFQFGSGPGYNGSGNTLIILGNEEVRFFGKVSSFPSWGCHEIDFTLVISNYLNEEIFRSTVTFFLDPIECGWNSDNYSSWRYQNPKVSYGIVHSGGDQVFYADNPNNSSDVALYNVIGTSSYDFAICSNIYNYYSNLSTYGTNFQFTQNGIYLIDEQQKVLRAQWDSQNGYVYHIVNNYAKVRFDSHIQVDDNGRVFYIGDDNHVSNIFGTNWQYGPLNSSGAKARANSDLVIGNDKVFYVDESGKIRVYAWTGTQWSSSVYNSYAINAQPGTEMIYGEGHLFYIGTDSKIHSIDGANYWQQYILAASAPNAYSTSSRTGMDFKNGKLIYVDNTLKLGNIYWTGSNWTYDNIDFCLEVKPGSAIEYSDYDERIYYISNLDEKLHFFEYDNCLRIESPTANAELNNSLTSFNTEEDGNTNSGTKSNLSLIVNDNNSYVKELSIFPNPTNGGSINIESIRGLNYQILGLDSRVVKTGNVKSNEKNTLVIENLSSGVYIFKWTDRLGNTGQQKIVKN